MYKEHGLASCINAFESLRMKQDNINWKNMISTTWDRTVESAWLTSINKISQVPETVALMFSTFHLEKQLKLSNKDVERAFTIITTTLSFAAFTQASSYLRSINTTTSFIYNFSFAVTQSMINHQNKLPNTFESITTSLTGGILGSLVTEMLYRSSIATLGSIAFISSFILTDPRGERSLILCKKDRIEPLAKGMVLISTATVVATSILSYLGNDLFSSLFGYTK